MRAEAPLSVLNTSIQATKTPPERDKEPRRQASSNPILTGWSGLLAIYGSFTLLVVREGVGLAEQGMDWFGRTELLCHTNSSSSSQQVQGM